MRNVLDGDESAKESSSSNGRSSLAVNPFGIEQEEHARRQRRCRHLKLTVETQDLTSTHAGKVRLSFEQTALCGRDVLVDAEHVVGVPLALERLEPGEGVGGVGVFDAFGSFIAEEVDVDASG